MNPAYVLAQTLESAGFGQLGTNIHVGRIPADDLTADDVWAVTALGGNPEGGNLIQHKVRYQLLVTYQNSDASEIYATDTALRTVLSEIPYEDPNFIQVNVGALQDQFLSEEERRLGQWGVEIVTFNVSTETEEES